MGLFAGKKGMVLGVANDFSIAWAITQKLLAEGAELGFTHLPGDKMERRVRKLADPIGAKLITPCDVQNDDDVARVFDQAQGDLRRARLRAPLDRVRADRRLEVPVRRTPAARASRRRWISASTRWRSWPGTRPACMPEGGAIAHPDLFRRRAGRPGLQHDGRLQGRPRRRGQVPGVRPRAARRSGSTPSRPGRSRRWRPRPWATPTSSPGSTSCRRRWAATSPARRSARPGCSCSRTSPAGSPARSSTSTAATTSWARPAARSRRVKAAVLEKVKAANPELAALLEKDDEFKRL